MRIIIDLQGAQGASRKRGIGRYSLSLAQAMVRNRGEHEIIVMLNGMFAESIEPIRAAFYGLLPREQIVVWNALGPVGAHAQENHNRRACAEVMREGFIASLAPDFVHITSIFEGYADDAVHTIGTYPNHIPTAVTLYDLIPMIERDVYLTPNPSYEAFYNRQIKQLINADLFLAISESSSKELKTYLPDVRGNCANINAATEGDFKRIEVSDADKRILFGKFNINRPFVMYSGATDERKNHRRLIEAFSLLDDDLKKSYQLVIVGGMPDEHHQSFTQHAKTLGLNGDELIITGRVTDREMIQLYNVCALFVFPSWHEGFGLPALEAMSCGAPVIGSNTSSIPEVIGLDLALFDPFDERSIRDKMTEVLRDPDLQKLLSEHGLKQAQQFSWDDSAQRALRAMEAYHAMKKYPLDRSELTSIEDWVIQCIANTIGQDDDHTLMKLASALAENHPISKNKQLFVDISELVHRDAKSGIQRVVRSIISELLNCNPEGYSVHPVYANNSEDGYRYANNFTSSLMGVSPVGADEYIRVSSGDKFIGLDLQHGVVLKQDEYYQSLRRKGVEVTFLIYDLLPILRPDVFPEGMAAFHTDWLNVISRCDGLICISRSVADELIEWLDVYGPKRTSPLNVEWFHLGADVAGSIPSKGLPIDAPEVLQVVGKRPSFLMVGTIEPRKGQFQTLKAFELLWKQGIDVNLVLIGKHGWNVEQLVKQLESHQELGKRLFWLNGVSDEYLEKIYDTSTCLIGASEGEGFGLPLIEAAQYKIPMILRDIPVFREVAKEFAHYFVDSKHPEVIKESVIEWLDLYQSNNHPTSENMPWLTWKQSTQQLVEVLMGQRHYKQWLPPMFLRYWGGDHRLGTQVGARLGKYVSTTNQQGFLIFGPYAKLTRGSYRIQMEASVANFGESKIDVVANGSLKQFFQSQLKDLSNTAVYAQATAGKDSTYCFDIELDREYSDVEVRIWVDGETEMTLGALQISRLNE